jgi:3-oxoacyl-[acyl-carrier-protein] synthase II
MSLEKRRVVVTGVGAVTPLGNTAEETWEAICKGESGVGAITRFDASDFSTRIAAEVKGFERRYSSNPFQKAISGTSHHS